jgi:hypothetical protein
MRSAIEFERLMAAVKRDRTVRAGAAQQLEPEDRVSSVWPHVEYVDRDAEGGTRRYTGREHRH